MITSRKNTKIKLVRTLSHRKHRDKQGLFVVEGLRHVGEALEAGVRIEFVITAPDILHGEYAEKLIEILSKNNIPQFDTEKDVFQYIASKDNPQGILAVVRQKLGLLEQFNPDNFPWGVAVVAAQDPGNVGTLMRTIDAVGASGLILLDGGVDPFHPTAVRASMGALFSMPIICTSFEVFKLWVKSAGYALYGSSAHAGTRYDQVEYRRPAILLLGGEREGLDEMQLAACDEVVSLPMQGRVTSLNISIAAGIFLYAMMQR